MKESAGKVLMFVENAYPQDTRVRNEALTLAGQGLKVSVIALRHKVQPFHEVVQGVSVYRLPQLTLFSKLPDGRRSVLSRLLHKAMSVAGYAAEYFYFSVGCALTSLIVLMREGFDVIHAHNPPDTLFPIAFFYALFGKKFVFDHHDLAPELYRSRYRAPSGMVSRVLGVCEKLSVRAADVVIATNESYRQIDIERNGAAPDSVFVVRNGPDLSRVRLMDPDETLRARAPIILGYVGAMNPQDGVDYLIRALKCLAFDLGRQDFFCVLIGDGDSRGELIELAKDLKLSDRVFFTGYIPESTLLQYLSTADICLDPNPSSPLNDVSTWIKVMEYMALGKPIVSFDLKETRWSAAEAAVYVEPNDVERFAQAIAALMDDPARRKEMGICGRARVADELGWHVTSQQLVRAYSRLFPTRIQPIVSQPIVH